MLNFKHIVSSFKVSSLYSYLNDRKYFEHLVLAIKMYLMLFSHDILGSRYVILHFQRMFFIKRWKEVPQIILDGYHKSLYYFKKCSLYKKSKFYNVKNIYCFKNYIRDMIPKHLFSRDYVNE